MKEIDPITPDIKTEVVKQAEVNSSRELVGHLRPQKNHTLFEFDTINKTISKATFTKKTISYEEAAQGKISGRKEVDVKEGCIYVPALNVKNAIKRFGKSYVGEPARYEII